MGRIGLKIDQRCRQRFITLLYFHLLKKLYNRIIIHHLLLLLPHWMTLRPDIVDFD